MLITVLNGRAGVRTFGKGAVTGALAGGLGILGLDLTILATSSVYAAGLELVIVDVLAFTALTTMAGGVSGWVIGKMEKGATT